MSSASFRPDAVNAALANLGGVILHIYQAVSESFKNYDNSDSYSPPLTIPEGLAEEDPGPIKERVEEAFRARQLQRHEALQTILAEYRRREAEQNDSVSETAERADREGNVASEQQWIDMFATLVAEDEAELHVSERDIHRCFCPLTQCLMWDPVCTVDGQTYERNAITTWLRNHNTSPLTNLQLPSKELTPNVEIQQVIRRVVRAVE